MIFTEVAFTCYPATDLTASRAFYENVLGLTPTMVTPMGDDGGWVEYELGPHTLAIGKAPGWLPSADGYLQTGHALHEWLGRLMGA